MKAVFPILLTPCPEEGGYVVFVPDLTINTQGATLEEAIFMARDAIEMMGVYLEDEQKQIPSPSSITSIQKENEQDIITLVDVDFSEYRRKNDLRTVKKNCTIPSWINFEAEKANLNFSALLQDAIKEKLHLSTPPS